jgi:hypothetical protein
MGWSPGSFGHATHHSPESVLVFIVTKITGDFDVSLKKMYLVVIAWTYVVLMMSLAEAFGTQGSVLGAIFTFVIYGVLPLSILVYILGTPARKKALQRLKTPAPASEESDRTQPDASGHAPRTAQTDSVSAVGEEQRRL